MELTTSSIFVFINLLVAALALKTGPNEDYYYAAVVEYNSLDAQGNDSILMTNAKEYSSIINKASSEADIIVFPELGLLEKDHYKTFVKVPFKSEIPPVDDKEADPALRVISKAARDNGVYVVINLHEEENSTLHYNTNLIFDREGRIIRRYRKYNLFNEPLNITKNPEDIYFDSDFGVRFGTFVCFDILFDKPALSLIQQNNVTDILYPTFWYSGLPYFTAVQTQTAWAYATDSNLIASGGNRPEQSTTGSGIYAGRKGPVIYLQSQKHETTILTAKIFKKGKIGNSTGKIVPYKQLDSVKLNIFQDPVIQNKQFSSELIDPTSYTNLKEVRKFGSTDYKLMSDRVINKELCSGDFCCTFNVNLTHVYKPKADNSQSQNNSYFYRLSIFSGVTIYGVENAGAQICSVISCLDETVESCGKPLLGNESAIILKTKDYGNLTLVSTIFRQVKISTKFFEKGSFVTPNLLELSQDTNVYGSLMNITQFSFESNEKLSHISFYSDKLITGGIYARVFAWDAGSFASSIHSLYFSTGILIFVSVLYCTLNK